MKDYLGGCSCGKIRYELIDEPMFTHCCHCHLCQQITGSAFITNTLIEGTNFKLTSGKLASFIGASGSGRRHIIKRCPDCGDPIVVILEGQSILLFLRRVRWTTLISFPQRLMSSWRPKLTGCRYQMIHHHLKHSMTLKRHGQPMHF